MLPRCTLSAFSALRISSELPLRQGLRTFASKSRSNANEADLEAAREWYGRFNKTTIPVKIATTSFARSGGPGGQKTNKTDSKAITTWPLHALLRHIPKVLHEEMRASSQTSNKEETHQRLVDEITRIYKKTVPGVTSSEQKQRVEKMIKADNAARLRMKKMHGNKKRARSGGGGHGD